MRSYLAIVFCLACLPAAALCGYNYHVDPLQYFRKAAFYEPRMYAETRFMNVGFAKHYDYDAVLLGTSMTENFRPSQMQAVMGGRFLKLSMAGSSPYEQRRLLQVAVRSRPQALRRVLWGIDQESWVGPPGVTEPADIFPDYPYDPWSIGVLTRYLASRDVYYISRIAAQLPPGADPIDFDRLGYWNGRYPFGCARVREAYAGALARGGFSGAGDDAARLVADVRANLAENLLPVVEQNPHITFYLFITPYSDGETYLVSTHFPAQLPARLLLVQQLQALAETHANVRFYDFQAAHAVTGDLSHYKDLQHYSAAVNDWMVEYMQAHSGMSTDAGYADYAKGLTDEEVFRQCEQ